MKYQFAIQATFALGFASIGSASYAASFPYWQHGEQSIDEHQVGYSDVTITNNGSVTIETRFSNGKRIGGNNFFAVTTFRSTSGNVLGYFVQWKGVDGSVWGRAREAKISDHLRLTAAQLAQFDHLDFRFGVKNCGFKVTGFHLGGGDKKDEVTMSTVECGNQPPSKSH